MTDAEILQHIDDGANHYVELFSRAKHMRIIDTGFYSYVKPVSDVYGISFIYNIRLDDLPPVQQRQLVGEIKALQMPLWLSLRASDELFRMFFGKDRVHGQTVFADSDEVYLALLPDQPILLCSPGDTVRKVTTAADFAVWTRIANNVLAAGKPDIHPDYHYPLCESGLIRCYMLLHEEAPVAVAAILDNDGIASLEFVATVPEMRRRGFAQTVCACAVRDAFANGSRIVTVRAIDAAAGRLYQSIGFNPYNFAI